MQKTILQVPLSKSLKHDAEAEALFQGFSSVQEVVRVFLAQFAGRKVSVTIQDVVSLSDKAEKRYSRMRKDFEKKKNVYVVADVKDLMKQLHENPLP